MSEERRQHVRELVDYPCWIAAEDGKPFIEARVANISTGGAMVRFRKHVQLPDNFALYMTREGKVGRLCKVIWRSPGAIGVTFIGPAKLPPQSETEIVHL